MSHWNLRDFLEGVKECIKRVGVSLGSLFETNEITGCKECGKPLHRTDQIVCSKQCAQNLWIVVNELLTKELGT